MKSFETPQPRKDTEFYDDDGRIKDPNIAHTMAHAENQLHEDKRKALEEIEPLRESRRKYVEEDFNKKEADLKKWMEKAPEEIRSKEEKEALIEAPSLLSIEEEAKLWERFDKLKYIKFSDNFRRVFETGKGNNNIEGEIQSLSFESFIAFLETLDLMKSNMDKDESNYFSIGADTQVKHMNGNTFEMTQLNESEKGKEIKVFCGNPIFS